MPEALEAEKRDALKFTSGIENQKAPSSHHCSGLFFCLFLWLSLWPRERLLNSSCATTNSGGSLYPNYHTASSSKCSSNEVFIGAILKPLGRNDYKAISTHFDATPSSKFSAKFVYSFVTD